MNSLPTFSAITPAVGAIASSIDLRAPLRPETIRAIREAILKHGVVFFRDQDLTRDQMAAFVEHFGTPGADPLMDDDTPHSPTSERTRHPLSTYTMSTYATRNASAVWHMDSTLAPEPAALLALQAIEMPATGGGDTCWGSMVAAYDTLSEPIKNLIDPLMAEHSGYKAMPLLEATSGSTLKRQLRSVHPVVIVHPETGRRALFVNELWTESIIGLSKHESDSLLAMLWSHSRSEPFTMRWKWRVNDIAVWDNRSFQHYAVMDYEGTRVLHKSHVRGLAPQGVASPARDQQRLRQDALTD